MSAFLCSDIQTWASALITIGHQREAAGANPVTSIAEARDVAMQYRALNNAAMAARYKDDGVPLKAGDAAFHAAIKWMRSHNHADFYRVLSCLRYQCSEVYFETQPGWATLAAACDAAKARAGATSSDVWSI